MFLAIFSFGLFRAHIFAYRAGPGPIFEIFGPGRVVQSEGKSDPGRAESVKTLDGPGPEKSVQCPSLYATSQLHENYVINRILFKERYSK